MCEEGQYHIKQTPPMYTLHNLHVQLKELQDLVEIAT